LGMVDMAGISLIASGINPFTAEWNLLIIMSYQGVLNTPPSQSVEGKTAFVTLDAE